MTDSVMQDVGRDDQDETIVGLYVRVSDDEQDEKRQIDETREYALSTYEAPEIRLYVDVISGMSESRGDDYERLWSDLEAGELDVVVVHEISRLSRLGAGAIHEFLEHALEHESSVKDLETGLEINLSSTLIDREVKKMIAGIMGDLARIEREQKLRRINSGIRTAMNAGKWTGRAPRGFRVEDGILHVEPTEYLETRQALARVLSGEQITTVADESGIPESSLRTIRDERQDLYLEGEADDDRVDDALEEIRPLEEPDVDVDAGELEALRSRLDELDRLTSD